MNTNLALAETEPLKKCAGCQEWKTLDEFGVNSANINAGARDGKNIRCKVCVRAKIAEHRQVLREYKAAHTGNGKTTDRVKQTTTAGMSTRRIARMLRKLSPADRVREAIRCGAREQKEIAQVTRLPKDEVCDALAQAILWDRTVRSEIRGNRRVYFIREPQPIPGAVLSSFSSDLMPGRKR